MMTGFRRLRYVKADQVNAGGISLNGLPLALEGAPHPVGQLDGLVIDLSDRRVRYLVVEALRTRRKHLLPLDATAVDLREQMLERVSSEHSGEWQPFDPSAFQRYDDDAMMALMFGHSAA
jgi:hypothetical protein